MLASCLMYGWVLLRPLSSEKTFGDVDQYKDKCWQRHEACYRQDRQNQYAEWHLELNHELDVLHEDGDEPELMKEQQEHEATQVQLEEESGIFIPYRDEGPKLKDFPLC